MDPVTATSGAPAAPAAPAAAPASSAPSTATSSAPATTSAPVTTAPQSGAPETTGAPATTGGTSQAVVDPAAAASPADTGLPAGPGAAAAKAEPQAKDYPDTGDGQMKFLADLHKWRKEQEAGQGTESREQGAGEEPAPAAPAEAAAEPAKPEEAKPEGEAEKPKADATPAPTPADLAKLMEAKPALKELLDADPELKGVVFAQARENARLKPLGEIYPTVEDAQFAHENAMRFVGLRTGLMLAAENPDSMPQVMTALKSEFTLVGADGKPVLDESGQPKLASDYGQLRSSLAAEELSEFGTRFTSEMTELQQKLASSVYPNEAAKQADAKRLQDLEYAAAAIEVVNQVRSGEYFEQAPPEIPKDATPEFKAWAEAERKKIEDAKTELQKTKQGETKQARQAERAQFNARVRGKYGSSVGKQMGELINAAVAGGMYIPQMALQERYIDPATQQETNTPAIAVRIFNEFDKKLKANPRNLATLAEHELMPINEQSEAARLKWYADRQSEMLSDIVHAELKRIEASVRKDQAAQAARVTEQRKVASVEPNSGGAGLPQAQSDAQIMTRAREVAAQGPEWANASQADREAMAMTQFHRLRRGQK